MSREDLDHSTGHLPLVGMVPTIDGWKNRGETHVVLLEEPSSQAAEAYRSLRTSLQFLGLQTPMRVVGVTSPGAGDGLRDDPGRMSPAAPASIRRRSMS